MTTRKISNKKKNPKVFKFWKMMIFLNIIMIMFYTNTVNSMTCILIYYHDNVLTIGADCMVSTPTGEFDVDGNRIIKNSTTCKIKKVNNTFLTGSGKQINLIIDFIENYYHTESTKIDLLSNLRDKLKAHLEERLNYLKEIDPSHFKESYDGFMFTRIAIIQFINDLPEIKIVAFSAKTNENDETEVEIFYQDPITLSPGEKIMIPFGRFEAIQNIYKNPNFWQGKSVVEGIENLLEIQANATPKEVGGPMSIITLTKNSYKWNKKGSCNF